MTQTINIDDWRTLAKRRLPRVVFDYLDGGAEDEVTLRSNRSDFESLSFQPRILTGGAIDTTVDLFGTNLAAPLAIAPTGLNGIFWREGDLCLARAANATGIGFSLSTASNTNLETVAKTLDKPGWFQLYPWGTPDFSAALLKRAEDAGYSAAIVTIDSLVPGNRERDRRNGFSHHINWSPGILLDGLLHPRWLTQVWLKTGMPKLENLAAFLPENATARDMADFSRQKRNPAFDWSDLERIRDVWDKPLIVKGVLSPADVIKAKSIGIDGVVVSNHGGRQLDGAPSAIAALPAVVEAAQGKMTILADGGFRRGTDIVKALALGADAVMAGRAPLYGLAAAGESGARATLEILTDELSRTMRLIGCRNIAEITRDCLA
ncbi:alpha-hydroxy acid oxidase [Amorphus sp. 3PC139-8]|uniref:alpha-hydroxy acid oxidase n=1 Tax=Amorphus sp. 3PC139-8 TaxID=2735676 RepID=UPI00345C6F2C